MYLGVHLDFDISFSIHVTKTAAACFSILRHLRGIRRSMPRNLFINLIVSLVFSRLDYCISILSGSSSALLRQLQGVLHAAARLVFRSTRYSHISPLLLQLEWLSVVERINLRLAVLAHSCCRGTAPSYLSCELVKTSMTQGRHNLRSSATNSLVLPLVRHSTLGGRSFPVTAARLWNSLPRDLSRVLSPAVFKKLLKSFLMKRQRDR